MSENSTGEFEAGDFEAEEFEPATAADPEEVEAVEEAAERERLRAGDGRPEPSDADDREEPALLEDPARQEPAGDEG